MSPSVMTVHRAGGLAWTVLLLLCCGCHHPDSSESPSPEAAPAAEAAATSAPGAPTTAAYQALPRAVGSIALGMRASDAEGKLGKLVCHTNGAGFQVCSGTNPLEADVRNLEVYLVHDQVVSVSYESPAPANVWDALNALIDRYGRPSLSGVRERDTNGRLHEIYGWKDDNSLYSVRFMWREVEGRDPELLGTAVAMWDRKGYQQWEAEAKPQRQPTPHKASAGGSI